MARTSPAASDLQSSTGAERFEGLSAVQPGKDEAFYAFLNLKGATRIRAPRSGSKEERWSPAAALLLSAAVASALWGAVALAIWL